MKKIDDISITEMPEIDVHEDITSDNKSDIDDYGFDTPGTSDISDPQDAAIIDTSLYKQYFKDIYSAGYNNLLTPEEEISLAKRISEGDIEARNELVGKNSRLVINVAKKYIGMGFEYIDLIQEGNLGLMEAAKRFDPAMGCRFSTYAYWWIRQSIIRSIADKAQPLSTPVHVTEALNKIRRAKRQLESNGNTAPTAKEISSIAGIDAEKVDVLLATEAFIISMSTPIGEDQETTIGDMIPDQSPSPESIAMDNDRAETIRSVLADKLSERELFIIWNRFDFSGDHMTLSELGNKLGLTRERVRQIESKAIKKLRHPIVMKRLAAYANDI